MPKKRLHRDISKASDGDSLSSGKNLCSNISVGSNKMRQRDNLDVKSKKSKNARKHDRNASPVALELEADEEEEEE